jgi:hypothetical protein
VISHVTGLELELRPDSSLEQARARVTDLRAFASESAADFTTLDGPARLSATVTQTRYFRWLGRVFRTLGSHDPAARTLALGVLAHARGTLLLVVLELALAAALALGMDRGSRRLGRRRTALAALVLFAAGIPTSVLALGAMSSGRGMATLLLVLSLAVTLRLDLWVRGPSERPLARYLARAGSLVPIAVSAELAVEATWDLGLGALARRALAAGDLTTLMWAALPIAVLGLIGGIAGGLDRPEAVRAFAELEPAEKRPRVLIGLGAWLASLALLSTASHWAAPGALTGLGATMVSAFVVLGVVGVVGVALGVLAGGLSRTVAGLVARSREALAALPQPFIASAALTFGGAFAAGLLALLRSVDVADALSRRLTERRLHEGMDPPSAGGTPLMPYLRRVARHAVRVTAVTVALSVPWVLSLEAAARALQPSPTTSLVTLASDPSAPFAAETLALLFLGALGCSLLVLALEMSPRELSAETPGSTVVLALKRRARSSRPPARPEEERSPLDETDGAR